jgi:methylated-DNA-[protein]-cysteine S-methyltransferase
MSSIRVFYHVDDWGVGGLQLEDGVVAWHELPRPSNRPASGSCELLARLQAYFVGEDVSFADVPLDLASLTPFQECCARVLRSVPRGELVSYGELAALAGAPGAARAAGSFCAQNRWGLFVPCHRVVSATGLGSYGSLGVSYKRRLLELEGVELEGIAL